MVGNRQEFHRELEAIEAKVIELFAMVAEDLPKATQALLSGDGDVLQVLAEREQVIDALYPKGDPVAGARRFRPAFPALGAADHAGA
jgi:phosphate uptake regulator